jgi:succinyl-diaminopimelate desuccinylase
MKEIIDFTRELIKIPSQNSIDSENKIANFILKKFETFGLPAKIIGSKQHPSVVCFLKKKNANKTIWLESALDTVSVGNLKKWGVNPFNSVIKANRLYGRGAADSKIAIAIFSYLAKELFEDKNFEANIFLGFDANEQSGDFTGIKEIVSFAPEADICILGYQGMDEICIGSRGFLRLKIKTFGKQAHTGSRRQIGINAIHEMISIINEILNLRFLEQKTKFFEFGPSLNVSVIKGGFSINTVPDECEALIDARLIPGQNKANILKEINQGVKKIKQKNKRLNFEIQILNYQPTFLTNPNNKFIKILQKNAKKFLKKDIPLKTGGAGTVGSVISQLKIPVINSFGCECGNIHAPNEWINIKTIPFVYEIYKESLLEFCQK